MEHADESTRGVVQTLDDGFAVAKFSGPHPLGKLSPRFPVPGGKVQHEKTLHLRPLLDQLPKQSRTKLRLIEVVLRDLDRKSTRLNSSHLGISYAVFCLKK